MAHPASTPASYVSPLAENSNFEFVSGTAIYSNVTAVDTDGIVYNSFYKIKITRPNGSIAFEQGMEAGSDGVDPDDAQGYTEQSLIPGIYVVYYAFTYPYRIPIGGTSWTIGYKTNTATYTFVVVENKLPLKKWTCSDVISRVCELAEPIRKGEKPRFRLQGDNLDGTYAVGTQAALFDTIYAPEFSMTKQTLRECLQQVGEIVHGEPRLTPKKDSEGEWYYEVTYDLFGQGEVWKHAHMPHVLKQVVQNANSYATSIDSAVENIVNVKGAVTEPYADGGKSMRAVEEYVRVTEDNMIFMTSRPIYTISSFEWLQPTGSGFTAWQIEPYLFEASQYGSQLSSYDGGYPNSKAFALMYTQGERNITQFNFKQERPIAPAFADYAIINILRRVTGDDSLKIDSYPEMVFRIKYVPFYQARVSQTKPLYDATAVPAAMIYNQQANIVDNEAYGENLKGVIARLGNEDRAYTYRLSRLSQIPKAGMKFDDEYYISNVSTEFLPNVILCTVAVTKDFNRMSRYTGISSVKRYAQVSQTMALERNILYKEYVVIGDAEATDGDSYIQQTLMNDILIPFDSGNVLANPITTVGAKGVSYQGNDWPAVELPVIASAFGNSMVFSWEYQDNYSAGPFTQYQPNGSVSGSAGYYQNEYQYTDYYGRMYYYHFVLKNYGPTVTPSNGVANELPGRDGNIDDSRAFVPYSTLDGQPYILRKDSREKLQVNLQIDFVTNRKDFIIGSALARNCGAVRAATESYGAKLYVLSEPLNKFTDSFPAAGIDLSTLPSAEVTAGGNQVSIVGGMPAAGKAWAIVTAQTTETEQVEDERGNVVTQSVIRGGDLLIGQNMEFSAGDAFPVVYFTKKREVFNKTVWKDIR